MKKNRLVKFYVVIVTSIVIVCVILSNKQLIGAANPSNKEGPDRITLTVNGDTKTQIGVTWYTPITTENSVLMVCENKGFGKPILFQAEDSLVNNGVMHKAVATGLEPGTKYYYMVGDMITNIFSEIYSFSTAGNGEFTFINLTDTQAKTKEEAKLSAKTFSEALKQCPKAAFLLHTGDFVQNGQKEKDWITMLNTARSTIANITLVPVAGNHEDDTNVFFSHFNLRVDGRQEVSTGVYYSFDYGMAHFVVLNTNESEESGITKTQLSWMEEDVMKARKNGARWIILSMHKGLYTTARHAAEKDVVSMRETLLPLIDKLDIDLVIQGHDHIYCRTKCLVYDIGGVAGGRVVEPESYKKVVNGLEIEYAKSPKGTYYLLSGTAGKKHYSQIRKTTVFEVTSYLALFQRSKESTDLQHFSTITISEDTLTVITYELINGESPKAIDGFGIDHGINNIN